MSSYAQATELKLKTKVGESGKSVIEEMYFTPPLKIINPIYEGDIANIMLLSVSAGLMNGDCQKLDINIGENSKVKITSQSYEKIHNTQDGMAARQIFVEVKQNAYLDFSPLPTIPFADSNFSNQVKIFLDPTSTLFYSDIFCAGRKSRDEIFKFKRFDSKLSIYINKGLVLYDNMLFEPRNMDLKGCCSFDKYTHCLSLFIRKQELSLQVLKNKILNTKINMGISENNGIIIVRALGDNSEELLELREKILKFLI